MVKSRGWQGRLIGAMAVTAALVFSGAAWAGKAELKGKFEILKDEVSTHKPGKVQLVEFADFYCPHCHRFDGEGVPLLEKEFGKKLDVTMVGYPVMPGKLPTAFDMYEQAKTMGKGDEMKAFEEGRKWGDRIKVQQTPTVLLDGNIKVEQIDPENLKMVIQSILDGDGKRP